MISCFVKDVIDKIKISKFSHETIVDNKNDIISTLNKVGEQTKNNKGIYGHNLVYKSENKNNVLISVHWDIERMEFIKCLLDHFPENTDIIFHMNNISDRQDTQLIAMVEIEKYMINNNYDYLWVVHSDVIPPHGALDKLLSHGKDIISAVVPQPVVRGIRGCASYLAFYDETHRRLEPHAFDNYFIYFLKKPKHNRPFNPTGKMLPSSGIIKVFGAGFGCILLSSNVINIAGHNIYYNHRPHAIDAYWCMCINNATDFEIWVDTEIKCMHLSPPMKSKYPNREETISDWTIDDSWYGWNLED